MSDNLGDVNKSQCGDHNQRVDLGDGVSPELFWMNTMVAGISSAVTVVCVLLMWWMGNRYETNLREMRDQHAAELRAIAERNVAAELARSKEFKQVQVQLMYSNAILLREGLAKPGDMVFGPEGNLEYEGRFKFKKEDR